jgi:hypothetical protein
MMKASNGRTNGLKGNPNKANKQFFCDSSERSKLEALWRRMHFDLVQ